MVITRTSTLSGRAGTKFTSTPVRSSCVDLPVSISALEYTIFLNRLAICIVEFLYFFYIDRWLVVSGIEHCNYELNCNKLDKLALI